MCTDGYADGIVLHRRQQRTAPAGTPLFAIHYKTLFPFLFDNAIFINPIFRFYNAIFQYKIINSLLIRPFLIKYCLEGYLFSMVVAMPRLTVNKDCANGVERW